jgi:hypothetical protein
VSCRALLARQHSSAFFSCGFLASYQAPTAVCLPSLAGCGGCLGCPPGAATSPAHGPRASNSSGPLAPACAQVLRPSPRQPGAAPPAAQGPCLLPVCGGGQAAEAGGDQPAAGAAAAGCFV